MNHLLLPLPPVRRRAARLTCAQAGFSVVELMVAMTVGLLLLAGLATLFANSSRSGNELEKSVRQLENGRYALELINDDIAMAGYFGEISLTDATRTTPDACATAAVGLGFQASSTVQVPVALRGIASDEAATCLTNRLASTPALVVHRLETSRQLPGTATAGAWHLQTSRCREDPANPAFILSQQTADFTLRGLSCASVLAVQRYITRIYYIASCNECGVDNVPTLKQAELVGSAMVVSPLAEGVQALAFEFGFDTDDDGEPNQYLTGLSGDAGEADNDWAHVVGVRVHMLSRATETSPGHVDAKTYSMGPDSTEGPFNDAFKRRAYTLTSRINNVAGPRENPLPLPVTAPTP